MFHFTPLASMTLIFGLVPVTSSLSNLKGALGMPSGLPMPMIRFSLEISPRSSQIEGAPGAVGAEDSFFDFFPPFSASLPFFCGAPFPLAFADDRDGDTAPARTKQVRNAKVESADKVR